MSSAETCPAGFLQPLRQILVLKAGDIELPAQQCLENVHIIAGKQVRAAQRKLPIAVEVNAGTMLRQKKRERAAVQDQIVLLARLKLKTAFRVTYALAGLKSVRFRAEHLASQAQDRFIDLRQGEWLRPHLFGSISNKAAARADRNKMSAESGGLYQC